MQDTEVDTTAPLSDADVKRLKKNEAIKEAGKKTREKRKGQDARVYTMKVDTSKVSTDTIRLMNRMFLESKWYYNYILSQKSIMTLGNDFYKNTTITRKVGPEHTEVTEELKTLSAKVRQGILAEAKDAICALSASKKKGRKVGKLKYRKECNCINFVQVDVDFKLKEVKEGSTKRTIDGNKYRIKLSGIKEILTVTGSYQLPNDLDLGGNAKLLRVGDVYFIAIVCYIPKKQKETKDTWVGLDYGIKTNLTTSDGKKYDICIPESVRLKKLQRKLSRQVKGSHGWEDTKKKIQVEYWRMTNKRKDSAKKIVAMLDRKYGHIMMQDESLKGWHSGLFGKQVQNSAMGTIKAELKSKSKTVVVTKWAPSTKMCAKCGKINAVFLSDRVYSCECGYTEDRDIHAAKNILMMGMAQLKAGA